MLPCWVNGGGRLVGVAGRLRAFPGLPTGMRGPWPGPGGDPRGNHDRDRESHGARAGPSGVQSSGMSASTALGNVGVGSWVERQARVAPDGVALIAGDCSPVPGNIRADAGWRPARTREMSACPTQSGCIRTRWPRHEWWHTNHTDMRSIDRRGPVAEMRPDRQIFARVPSPWVGYAPELLRWLSGLPNRAPALASGPCAGAPMAGWAFGVVSWAWGRTN
jgi:hypothetical protein